MTTEIAKTEKKTSELKIYAVSTGVGAVISGALMLVLLDTTAAAGLLPFPWWCLVPVLAPTALAVAALTLLTAVFLVTKGAAAFVNLIRWMIRRPSKGE